MIFVLKPASSQWLGPMLALGAIALAIPAILFTIDHFLAPSGYQNPLAHYLNFNDEAVSNSIGVLSSIIAAVLGIIITVASIIVQLAATRYTPAVTEMFLRDRNNLFVMSFYVVGCVMGFWTAFAVNAQWVPRVSLLAMLIMATIGFVIMAPYFAYMFRFLSPQSVVARIKNDAANYAIQAGRVAHQKADSRQTRVLELTEQLTDIAINSISQKDKIIATSCVDALRDLAMTYLEHKHRLDSDWFELRKNIQTNPDFSSMAKSSVLGLKEARTWFEFKILRQYQAVYTEALGNMRDINYVIAINTRQIAEKALETDMQKALELSVKFFNTYMRATLNQNDVRTAYTILNQYRIMAESMMRKGQNAMTIKIASYIHYYGQLSHKKRLAFVTETVAYDLGTLCEIAHEVKSEIEADLLRIFLEVDPKNSEDEIQEASLRGVRKAQIKLATFYLVLGHTKMARQIWQDMAEESIERLVSIRKELLAIDSKDFWEISDRGDNFDYLEPERKATLNTFFGWFGEISSEFHSIFVDTKIN